MSFFTCTSTIYFLPPLGGRITVRSINMMVLCWWQNIVAVVHTPARAADGPQNQRWRRRRRPEGLDLESFPLTTTTTDHKLWFSNSCFDYVMRENGNLICPALQTKSSAQPYSNHGQREILAAAASTTLLYARGVCIYCSTALPLIVLRKWCLWI